MIIMPGFLDGATSLEFSTVDDSLKFLYFFGVNNKYFAIS